MESLAPHDSRSSDEVFSTPPEQTYPHRSKLYSPESPSPARRRPYSAEGPTVYMHINPPIRRSSPLNPQRSSGQDRRRPSSNDGPGSTSEALFRVRRSPLLIPVDDHLPQGVRNIPELDVSTNDASAFSDEYNLSREDPRILQDVHRALKVKAKREAKTKTATSSSDHHTLLSANIPSSPKSPKSPGRQPYPHFASPTPPSPSSSPIRKTSTHNSSDIDFSPSTRRPPAQSHQHPVPSSLDNGLTLDWGSSTFDEEKTERKWSISVRRKDKDKFPPLELMQDQQEKNHRERLSKLRASASSQTLRKAAMTSDQLQRRYSLMQEVSENQPIPLSLAMVSRWYGSQRENKRQELEKVEPLTWLKHLPRKAPRLSRWHLSARIMEEFVAAQADSRQLQPQYMESIPEDDSLQPISPIRTREQSPERLRNLETKFQSPRGSFESRRSAESVPSSIVSGSSNPITSPVPSLGYHSQPKVWPSPRPENAGSGTESFARLSPPTRTTPYASPDIQASPFNNGIQKKNVIILGENLPKLVLPLPDVDEDKHDLTSEDRPPPSPSPNVKPRSKPDLLTANRRFVSSPLLRQPPPPQPPPEDSHKEFQNEEALRKEYGQKAVLLENAKGHNQRIRHLLNRVSNSVKEYDAAQRTATNVLGKKYQPLPKELAESFGHDPAAVTGATRRLTGWRAVEDIHQRLARQREVFAAFIQTELRRPSDYGSILDDQISSLIHNLSTLEEKKVVLSERMKEVESVLRDAQKVHKKGKEAYDNTVSLTSALYPEISQAIALEESYKDQYQQIWEFGMDALTLILDTVTPFWRNYGKVIGEDIRDFLIVPLYRNEFTGESKRYSLHTLPKRSPYHWLGLGLFFFTTILLTTLQARVAISSTVHSRLQWISIDGMRYTALPFFWLGILMQWCFVLLELGISLMEAGVIVWWLGWSINLLT